MTAFYVLGGILAAWALVVTALGVSRHDFPGGAGGEKVVMAISSVLVLAAAGAAIIGGANQPAHGGGGAAHEAGSQPSGEHAAPAAPAGGEALAIAAAPDGSLSFDKKDLVTKPGKVTITMTNPSANPHDISLEGSGVDEKGEIVSNGQTSTVSADLKAGDYTFYCSVPGHRQGGMEGTLTVGQ